MSDFHGSWHANVRTGGVDGMGKTADEKFFELRESGYTGPIDQDGNAVEAGREVEHLTGQQP